MLFSSFHLESDSLRFYPKTQTLLSTENFGDFLKGHFKSTIKESTSPNFYKLSVLNLKLHQIPRDSRLPPKIKIQQQRTGILANKNNNQDNIPEDVGNNLTQ